MVKVVCLWRERKEWRVVVVVGEWREQTYMKRCKEGEGEGGGVCLTYFSFPMLWTSQVRYSS